MDNGQIFTNGTIFTMDSQNPIVEAVGVKDGLIKCAGSLDQVCSVMPDNSVTVDLELQTMLPSFIDPHGHFPDTGFIELFRADTGEWRKRLLSRQASPWRCFAVAPALPRYPQYDGDIVRAVIALAIPMLR